MVEIIHLITYILIIISQTTYESSITISDNSEKVDAVDVIKKTPKRYIELALVIDNAMYKVNGENNTALTNECKHIVNIVNSLYTPLNISVVLVGVVVWSEFDENLFTDLAEFLNYRKNKLLPQLQNDHAVLITQHLLRDGLVAKVIKGPICTYDYSGSVVTNHSSTASELASTIAHAIGHNLGMEHDTSECICPEDKCIMSKSYGTPWPKQWSSCSIYSVVKAFERHMDYCMMNKPEKLFEAPTCGNGILEDNEQCDCILDDDSCERCCDINTCTLKANATCSSGDCCNQEKCSIIAEGTLCRSADGECDLPEFCTGDSEICPRDIFKMDSTPCHDNEAYCYQGSCKTRDDQCRLLYGITGKDANEHCYNFNSKGTRQGNCGYDPTKKEFMKCNQEDVMCGRLQCNLETEQLLFGLESTSIISQIFFSKNGTIFPCRQAIIDFGLGDVDPGLVPNGAKCGDNKICIKQRCIAIEELRSKQ